MSGLFLGALIVSSAGLAYVVWKNWIVPWNDLTKIIAKISEGQKAPTFLIGGSREARRAALALEELYHRQQKLAQQVVERSSGTQTILAAMQDGLLVVDSRQRITLFNHTFQQLFGLHDADVGQPLREVVRIVTLDQLLAETLRMNAPQRGELALQDPPSSAARQFQLSAVPMKNPRGEAIGAVVLFHDITQLKQTDEIRRDFVANVSHELRTPLSILRGYIETLQDNVNTSPAELVRILEVMEKHSKRLGALVDDLLSLAQLESTNPNLQVTDVRIGEVFAGIVRDWGKKFGEKKLRIDVAVPANFPVVRADETRLQEVLYNLLDNALKYSHPGGKIRLQAQRHGEEVALSVSDTGVGISETDLPRIFERFYRTDKARSRELGGTGLGLSIVKHIAQMHGGRVEAESELGRGSTIRVWLPINGSSNNNDFTVSVTQT